MSYPTMCCDAEPETVKSATGINYSLKNVLIDTQEILFETHDVLLDISRSILNTPTAENEVPKVNCMNDQAIVNRNMAGMCRSLAMEIKNMLFGGEQE